MQIKQDYKKKFISTILPNYLKAGMCRINEPSGKEGCDYEPEARQKY